MSNYVKDLSNLYVSESFPRLLQISGSNNTILTGTGNEVNIVTTFDSLWESDPNNPGILMPANITGSNIMISTDPFFTLTENNDIQPRDLHFMMDSDGNITQL